MKEQAYVTIHFIDGTSMTIEFTRENKDNLAQIAADVKKGIELEAYSIEVDGSLLVIPRTSVKYLQVTPAPEALPKETVRNGSVVD